MFNIIGFSRFLPLHIIRHISVITSRKRLVAVVAIWFKFMALFKFAKILNFKVRIEMDLATSLILSANSIFDFDCLSLIVAFLYKIPIFF